MAITKLYKIYRIKPWFLAFVTPDDRLVLDEYLGDENGKTGAKLVQLKQALADMKAKEGLEKKAQSTDKTNAIKRLNDWGEINKSITLGGPKY
jgi:hypothetical protein